MDIVLLLIGINVLLFVLPSIINFGGNSFATFLSMGAKDNSAIIDGEYYRLLTATFLHANFLHLFLNMYSLWSIGRAVTTIFGNTQFVVLYLLTGISGSIFSFLFNPNNPSVGASGSIFGLVGALLSYSIYSGNYGLLSNLLFVTVVNLAFGIMSEGIDNWGHLGGLVLGVVLGFAFLFLFPVSSQAV